MAVGNHCFSKPLLEQYRDSVVDEEQGPALSRAVNAVKRRGNYEIGEKHYKKTPRGYDPTHENAEFLLYNGLTAFVSTPIPEELYSRDILDYCLMKFKDMQPIHTWLLHMINRMTQ